MSATVVLCCGEMSGDIHAAPLVRHLREKIPDVHVLAMGGERCAQAGADIRFDYRDYAIIGFSAVLANLPRLHRLERSMKRLIEGADLFIAVDYPGLNLRLAQYAKKLGVPVLYYIAPQLWAWGAGRMKKIAHSVDRLAVILPFEEAFYRKGGVNVEFVGHPFVVDHDLPPVVARCDRDRIGLLPGSRTQEVYRILPALIGAAEKLSARDSALKFTIGKSPLVSRNVYDACLDGMPIDVDIDEDAVRVMRHARLVLVASGTATLQSALYETPLIVVYRVSPLNYFLARRLITIENIGLVNVVLGERVAPEFIQGDATAENISIAAMGLLENESAIGDMTRQFSTLRDSLGGGKGTARVVEMAVELMGR